MTATTELGNAEPEAAGSAPEHPALTADADGRGLTSAALEKLVRTRLAILLKLEALAQDRQKLLQMPDLTPEVHSELARQARELKRFPTAEVARQNLEQMQERLKRRREGIIFGGLPPISESLTRALDLSARQWRLFVLREELVGQLLATAGALSAAEPLFELLSPASGPPPAVLGWANYATAVEAMRRWTMGQRDGLVELREQTRREDRAAIDGSLAQLNALIAAAGRELTLIEPAMVESFWTAYSQAAAALAEGAVAPHLQPPLRAFLRYGLISTAPGFIDPDLGRRLLEEAGRYIETLDESVEATHVFYADEYIDLVARGWIPPSVDEDLELNQRGSTPWLRDKAWRRSIAARARTSALQQVARQLEGQVRTLHAVNASLASHSAGLEHKDRHSHSQRASAREEIHGNQIRITRAMQALERIRLHLLPEEELRGRNFGFKISELGGPYSPGELARREAERLHRVCRLCAKLKDPFPPFVLRDRFRPECVNDRDVLLREIREMESSDPTVFKESIVPSRRSGLRVDVRYSPYLVLSPCCGFLGFSWNPRTTLDAGRLVVPLYTPRAGILKMMLLNLFADFRWDTSKDSAGMDVLTSDTLVAAYGTVRWEYRHRSKDTRQKAGIYSHETDRKNWRRHYALFVTSAHEGGKKLFFKCPDIYNVAVKYLGLPDGIKPLKK